MSAITKPLAAYLVRGQDPTLVADATRRLVADLVAEGDPRLMVEELAGDTHEVRDIVDAAQTPPFLSERRVVVGHDIGRFLTAQVAPLVTYLDNPLPTTSLVLVSSGGQVSRPLVEAVRRTGHLIDASAPTGKARSAWFATRLKAGPVRLDAQAAARVADHLGDDLGRLDSLLETLAAAYGPGARVDSASLEDFLGESGGAAVWDLTDAIDKGDTGVALKALARITGPGGRHGLVVLASLHTHVARVLRLDGAGVFNETEAAAALGMTGSTFRAAKALRQSQRWGHEGVRQAVILLADADVALKGNSELSSEVILEVLVARLCRLAGRR